MDNILIVVGSIAFIACLFFAYTNGKKEALQVVINIFNENNLSYCLNKFLIPINQKSPNKIVITINTRLLKELSPFGPFVPYDFFDKKVEALNMQNLPYEYFGKEFSLMKVKSGFYSLEDFDRNNKNGFNINHSTIKGDVTFNNVNNSFNTTNKINEELTNLINSGIFDATQEATIKNYITSPSKDNGKKVIDMLSSILPAASAIIVELIKGNINK